MFSHAKFMVPEVYELLPVAISFHILNVQRGDSIFQQSCVHAGARVRGFDAGSHSSHAR